MRQAGWVTMVLLVAATTCGAQPGEAVRNEEGVRPLFSSRVTPHPGKALRGYSGNLESTNDGVVESSVAHIAFMVLVFPELDRNAVLENLEKLSLYGSTPAIRYKAYLASLVARNPVPFRGVLDREYHDPDAFFVALSESVQAALLGAAIPQ